MVFYAVHLIEKTPDVPLPLFLGISALLALSYLPFFALPVDRWQENLKWGILHLIIGYGLLGVLLAQDAGSFLLVRMFFPTIFPRFSIRWAVELAITQTIIVYLLYVVFHFPENWLIIMVIILAFLSIATLMGTFIAALITQSLERQRLMEELSQTCPSLYISPSLLSVGINRFATRFAYQYRIHSMIF